MYLAQKCGWDKDFIAEHFTIGQLKLYFELLNRMELSDTKRMAIAFRVAQCKDEDFQKFLDDGKGEEITGNEGIEKLRNSGIPFEEQ